MIALVPLLVLALQAAPPAAMPVLPNALGPQSMPRQGCAAFLWSVSDRKMVAVASAAGGTLRVALDGKPVDYPRTAQSGTGGFGFAASTRYGARDIGFTLDMTVSTEAELTDGGLVQQGMLTIERAGADATLIPVAGVIGCAAAQ
ncbi:hypothetical protein Q5H91_01585 [Sphingomonas sp. KR1UV-12]|uniref:Uncharacterized protein n=1 Tax=Sphingomonas aurea TaxID=3063994 RepID=A0ABT9EG00_9SPHN|nr:hypothetical protein [Sphingomonas sp. KR1UV-12]MDP1025896.1 hypothetical protein [Sphingomonas sp. KR1UV-12]